jgi:hypothetical protein
MGSKTSKPRKGHEHPQHLPKVGSPANLKWEHETHQKVVFGSTLGMVIIAIVVVLAVIGLLLLTL